MNKQIADELIMLLSTDWFFDQWLTIGIEIDEHKRRMIQIGCREIVRQIISTANDYWRVSFSDDRLENTRNMFTNLLRKSEASSSVISKISALASGSEIHSIDSSTKWALLHFTELIALDSSETEKISLAPETKAKITAVWYKWEIVDCENSSTKPISEWDRYVRDLTPDLPSRLCEYLRQDLLGKMKFEFLWEFVHRSLTIAQRSELFECYRMLARSLEMEGITIPTPLE